MNSPTLLLIDGHSMAFRSFYALPFQQFRTQEGIYTNAVFGFTKTLLRLLRDYQPDHVAVAFDLPGGTFRTRVYGEYKGGRAATPEEFKGQISLIQQLLEAIGITWITVPDYEADDILATLSQRGAKAGMKVWVASGDRDAYQLVNEQVTVLYPQQGKLVPFNAEKVREKTGVTPDIYPDMAALVGEKADNLPGVPLVGPVRAQKWLEEYGSLEAILENADKITGKAGDNLRESLAQVRRNRELNALVRDLEIEKSFAEMEVCGVDLPAFSQLCATLDFNHLRSEILHTLPVKEGAEPVVEANSQLRELKEEKLSPGALENFLAAHSAPFAVAVKGNTKAGQGTVESFSIAAADGSAITSDFAALPASDKQALAAWLANVEISKVGHNVKGMNHAWIGEGMRLYGTVADTEIQAALLHPDQRKYEVDKLCLRYLALDISSANDGTLGINADGTLGGDNFARRTLALLDLADFLNAELAKTGTARQVLELELAVLEVLTEMEERGICVDRKILQNLAADFAASAENATQLAYRAIDDENVNLSSPKQLQAVLFDKLQLPPTKKTKSGSYTTNAEALADLLEKISNREDAQAVAGQQFLSALLARRDAVKLSQSITGLQESVQKDSHIRTTFQQTTAATGRLSSTDPNLQNIHARTAEGQRIRSAFVPSPDYDLLLTADYSQIEMRLMAHLSGDSSLIQAFNDGADLHRYVASRVYKVPEAEVTASQRSHTKAMSYGLVYGLSAYGLAAQLHISPGAAQNLMDEYFSRFGKVRDYLQSLVEKARADGYTETITGRRRYLPELSSQNTQVRKAAERMALNAPIQGSAADIIKKAMWKVELRLQRENLQARMLLQVHDELIFELPAAELAQVEALVREEMENTIPLSVPLSVGIGSGANWQLAAH